MRKTPLFWIGIVAFSALLFFSLLFYKERVAFVDAAFHLFTILKDHSVQVFHHRVAGVMTQAVPWLMGELRLPLKAIAMAYSASYYMLYLLVFVLIARWLKNGRMALVFLLFHTLMAAHVFYLMVSELYQGLALLFLYLAAWENGIRPRYFWPLTLLIIPIAALAHPLMIFPFTFMVAFLLLSDPGKWRQGLGLAVVYLAVFALKTWVFSTAYDRQAFSALNNIRKYYPAYWELPSFHDFLRYLYTDYYFMVPALLACTVLYIRRRRFGKLFLMLGYFAALSFLVNIAYVRNGPQFYLEHQFQLLAIFVGMPLAYDLFPEIKKRWVVPGIVAVIVGACLLRVYGAHTPYSKRQEWLREVMAQTASLENRKLILSPEQAPLEKSIMTWGISYETWLLSTMEQGETRSLLIEDDPGEYDKYLHRNKAFIGKWKTFDYSDFEGRYFVFGDTTKYVRYEP